jgi:hypothetical protein
MVIFGDTAGYYPYHSHTRYVHATTAEWADSVVVMNSLYTSVRPAEHL